MVLKKGVGRASPEKLRLGQSRHERRHLRRRPLAFGPSIRFIQAEDDDDD